MEKNRFEILYFVIALRNQTVGIVENYNPKNLLIVALIVKVLLYVTKCVCERW